jgi:hypothetical protein
MSVGCSRNHWQKMPNLEEAVIVIDNIILLCLFVKFACSTIRMNPMGFSGANER